VGVGGRGKIPPKSEKILPGEAFSKTNFREMNLKQMFNARFYSDSISSKLSRTVVSIEDRSCTVFGPNQPNEEGCWRLRKFENFLIFNPLVREYGKAYSHPNFKLRNVTKTVSIE